MCDSSFHLFRKCRSRTSTHRLYRCFKFVTVAWALLLLIAQIVSVVFLPFDGVELALKFFVSSFSVLVVLNELECWKALRGSPLFWNFVPRGVSFFLFYFRRRACAVVYYPV